MGVCPENLISPGQHIFALPKHATIPTVLFAGDAAWEEVTGHVLRVRIC